MTQICLQCLSCHDFFRPSSLKELNEILAFYEKHRNSFLSKKHTFTWCLEPEGEK